MPAKVCDYCRSVVTRTDDKLVALGKAATLPEDVSPLQLGARGRWEDADFLIVGRMRWRWSGGAWTEWLAVREDDTKLWLGDAVGRFMVLSECPPGAAAAAADELGPLPMAGRRLSLLGVGYQLMDAKRATIVGAEGELPYRPARNAELRNLDFANDTGRCASIQTVSGLTTAYAGRYADLQALEPRGLRPVPGWQAPAFADA